MEAKHAESHLGQPNNPQDLVERLWELEDDFPPELREACLAAGTALVPELIHQLEGMLDVDALDWPSIYAAQLLGSIGDSQAAPVLLRCLQHSEEVERLHHEASQALVKLGSSVLESCLAAYADSSDDTFRDDIACVLDGFETRVDRIYEILLETLERSPELGANCLAEYGDSRAVPALMKLFDDLPINHEDSPLANRVFIELRCAIEDLGGTLTAEQERKFEQSDVQRRRFVARIENVMIDPSVSSQREPAINTRQPVVGFPQFWSKKQRSVCNYL